MAGDGSREAFPAELLDCHPAAGDLDLLIRQAFKGWFQRTGETDNCQKKGG